MRNIKLATGQRIAFHYDGKGIRVGIVNRAWRAKKTNFIIINIFDEMRQQYRSFHFRKMTKITVGDILKGA